MMKSGVTAIHPRWSTALVTQQRGRLACLVLSAGVRSKSTYGVSCTCHDANQMSPARVFLRSVVLHVSLRKSIVLFSAPCPLLEVLHAGVI